MNNKYCSNCKQANPQERTFCFFCEGNYFVNSLDESSGKGVKKKIESRPTKKVEETKSGEEDVLEKNQRKLSDIMIDNGQFEELIEAQNRTTHAVRAFVRFLFIQLTASTIAIFLWVLSIALSNNAFFAFLSGLVMIAGVIWSSYAGWSELEKSEVD